MPHSNVRFAGRVVSIWLFAFFVASLMASGSPREHCSLDANWKFHLGEDWPYALKLNRAGVSTGPASPEFDDSAWRTVDLPHDWAVELPFDRTAECNHGFKPVGPKFPQNSIGWYRRTFTLSAGDGGKRISLQFDGVFRDATVWVNGWLVMHHESGYSPFDVDITDLTHFGGQTTVTVRVDASKSEGWFYEGAGIYRHVWLNKTSPVAIAPDGVFVYATFKNNVPGDQADIHAEVRLLNCFTNPVQAVVKCDIIGPDSETQKQFQREIEVASSDPQTVRLATRISKPILWSPESPTVYKLITTVEVDGRLVDQQATTFGLRTISFDAQRGFILNGKPYLIKGTCNHQDHAGVGVALPDALQDFRIAKLKEFGDNAYRTSHHPPTPELLDACDRMGMLVMDESRLLGSDPENLRRWEQQIRRDRNHPSVFLWSIANEEFAVEDTEDAARVALSMQNLARRLDPTREVTYAAPEGDVFAGINSVIQVRGWNYHIIGETDRYHAEHPDQPNIGTEQASTVSTRGIYENNAARGHLSAYDVNYPGHGLPAETWWSYFAARPWLAGGFVWTGFDYRGEPTPYNWPCINSHFGILDTCGFPKDNFYYYQAWWTTNVVLHLLPHWNWPGREGQMIRVDALSNCGEVELFLNGKTLGRQTMKPNSKLSWKVKYAPGTLSAMGYDNGRLAAKAEVSTTGGPVAVELQPNRTEIKADGRDVSVFTVSALDAQGRFVPVAQNLIQFELHGPGKIIGVGNGDPSCHEPDVFAPQIPVHSIPISNWRWQFAELSAKGAVGPEEKVEFDDSGWHSLKDFKGSQVKDMVSPGGRSTVFRTHIKLKSEDLENAGIEIRFGGGFTPHWVFVNNQRLGEVRDWSAQSVFELKKNLHAGTNLVAFGISGDPNADYFHLSARLEMIGRPIPQAWSRSLFNGLAQVMVQSTRETGEITLVARSAGMSPATNQIQSVSCVLPVELP